ncbi:MAG TPA: uridine phosphorylase [Desulfobacteraceae bacterium]|nr:uridine phosphorylase [Desulfobacteraceae bacterium]
MSYPTWSDLNSPSVVPPLGARQAPDIGPAALMVSTAPDLRYISATQGKFSGSEFFTGRLLKGEGHNEGLTVAGPYIGAPYAVMLLESLIAKGARQIVILGWCGAISNALVPGDILVPERAIVDEGTSRHYATLTQKLPSTSPDKELNNRLISFLESGGMQVHTHPLWTTDAIYRETREKVNWYRDKGAAAVETECSALFAAAAHRKVNVAALLVVSDSLATPDGAWDPGFRKKQFKTMRKTACKSAVDFTRTLVQ